VKFSVVTPSFRQFDYLKLCARSVADQAVEFEHIIQDAGTGAGLEEWVHSNTSAALYIEKDAGMYDAINRGLRRATGDICSWLNCDEQYLPGALAKVREFFETHPATEVLFGDAILIGADGELLSYRRAVRPRRSHIRFVHLNTLSCAMFFRRKVFEEHPFDPQWKAIGDSVWVDGLLAAGRNMAILREPLATFAFTGENLSATGRAAEEARRWQGADWRRHITPIISFAQRLEKWRAGAYRKRDLTVELYTPESGDRRVPKSAKALGYGWPGATQPATSTAPVTS
jgi:glycosyltransferase involved in cell wall biosynthesis